MPETTLETLLEHRASFLNFVDRRVGDRALAEDILQAAYMRALQTAKAENTAAALREEESAVAWFYKILRNAVIDHYRRKATETAAMDRWAKEFGEFGEEGPAVPEEARQFVCGCIERVLPQLRPAYAEVLRAVDLEEQPLTEFARRHELTPGNAAVRAHRARTALRTALAKFCGACSLHACLDCVCKQTGEVRTGSA